MKKHNTLKVWEVPNSRIVITLRNSNILSDIACGVSFKERKNSKNLSWNVYTVSGEDEFNAIETLLAKTQEASEKWWEILQLIQSSNINEIKIKNAIDWWNFPNDKNYDFDKKTFQMLLNLKYNNLEIIFLYSKDIRKYCACLYDNTNDNILFKASASGLREKALNNLNNVIVTSGAYLDKIQKGAWEALIDRENPNNGARFDLRTGTLLLTK